MTHTRRLVPVILLIILCCLLALPGFAQSRVRWDDRQASIYRADGTALTLPSAASPVAVVAQFLGAHGRNAATVRSIAAVAHVSGAHGLVHARMEQRVNGRVVYGSYAKAAFNQRGQLVDLIENLADVGRGRIETVSIGAAGALRAALGQVHPGVMPTTIVRRDGDTTWFARGRFFHSEPTVQSVIVAMTDGSLREAYAVTTWSEKKNLLHETLVSGEGVVLNIENRTNSDSYNIYPISPNASAQTLVSGPGITTESPAGWLGTGSQFDINISGNNVHSYLDADANNAPDGGGTPVTTGNFTAISDLSVTPSSAGNRAVAIQNLFYLNNLVHDELYAAGFNEAAANFQEDNFGNGGRGSDSVYAEAQDGGGTDNANFATPREGSNPRMQMYLWTGRPSHQVVTGSGTYDAAGAEFGAPLNGTGVSGSLAVASPADGCTAISPLSGIAIIDRGTCTFVTKVKNAQDAGASGVIVVNNAGDNSVIGMGGTDATITISSVFVGHHDGTAIKAAAPGSATIRATDPPPLQRDGDLDSDIVFHEYGHGLTWRMIGRMDGAMAGAIGEGMSDVLAVVLNGDDRVGEYSASDPLGIRSAPYTNFPRTYSSVTGSEVHYDGEVYGAIGWRLRELYVGAGLTTDDLLLDLVQGMNFTPAKPTFEQMRDGILSASSHDCLVWTAFAQYGVGDGAKARVRGATIAITESFAIPAGVCP